MFKFACRVGALALLAFAFSSSKSVYAQIAPGVTQSAAHTANITGTIIQTDGAPIANADVKLSGTAELSTKSDAHGTFAFTSVPWGIYQIVITSALGTASRNVTVNGDITVAIQYQAQAQANLRTIAHVSTSSAGAHINVTSSGITSINPSQYAFQGNGTWTQLFAQIPGVAVSGYASGGSTTSVSTNGSPMAPVVLSLNGALPYETSTTLDGMPLYGTSSTEQYTSTGGGVDLSMLPVNGFDTADIVRGPGANSPSIVSSVGGSFVLHPPGEVDANQFDLSVSNDPYGGIVSNAKVALHLGKLSAIFVYGVNDSPGPLGTSNVMAATPSTPLTIGGQPVSCCLASFPYISQGIPLCYCLVTDTMLYCCAAQSTAWTEHGGAASLSYKITPWITAGIFYAGSTSHTNTQGGYFPVEFAPSATVPAYSGTLMPSPTGQPSYSLLDTFGTSLNSQSSSLLEEKVTAYIGRGVLRLAALQYNSFYYENVYASLPNGQYTLYGTACIGGAAPNAACPYGGTATAYNGTPQNLTFTNESVDYHAWSNNRDLLGSYAVQVGSSSSVGVSFVTSYYNDPYSFNLLSANVPFYSVGNSSAVSETTNETRVHVDTEVGDKLSLGLSWYFTQSTDHVPVPSNPSQWTNVVFPYNAPRFGAVWQANHDIAIRASAGGGYALPTLNNLTGYSLSLSQGQYSEIIANLNLKPEETFGFDVGTDVRFHHDTVLSLDLYQTNLYGQFFSSFAQGTLNGLPLFISQSENLGASRYAGINLDIHRDVPVGMYWRGTLGLTRGYVVSVPPGFYDNPTIPCVKCTNQYVVLGSNFNGAYTAAVPYANASGLLGYRWSSGKYVDLIATYYGSNNQYYTPGAFVELDAHAGYAITKHISLLATFKNITGMYDQSVQTYNPGYAIPVIPGASPAYPGAAFTVPYGPRTIIVTANFK